MRVCERVLIATTYLPSKHIQGDHALELEGEL